ncbi:hypothetical protein BofuT4_uP150980.1 [Botrytis cinerea T4]|uniref:Uncharacterized protein n=1 Tax=Botryotinia fuckeliana (strain T4) TaxID=999810 RepID=G2YWG8_BOTF4|nr:hypothetical protein BofuT4_uP150980.1 [Botrytis cinerea T4]
MFKSSIERRYDADRTSITAEQVVNKHVMKISFIFSLLFLIIHVGMMVEQQVVSKGGNSS